MKNGADWFAWSLQFLAGLVVGGLAGVIFLADHSRRRGFIDSPQAPVFLAGTALIGAALASFYGDELWLGDSYRAIPPNGIAHSEVSRIASVGAGVLGGLLVLGAVLRQLGYL